MDEIYVNELCNGKTHCSQMLSNKGNFIIVLILFNFIFNFIFNKIDGISALQSSLIACGKLISTENQISDQIESKIQQSILDSGIRQSKVHAKWLIGLEPYQQSKIDISNYSLSSPPSLTSSSQSSSLSSNHPTQSLFSYNKSKQNKKSLNSSIFPKVTHHVKGSMLENDLESKSPSKYPSTKFLSEDSIISKNSKKSKNNLKSKSNLSYDSDLAYHLHTETKDTSNNPFREKDRDSKNQYSAAKSLISLRNHFVDPKDYSKDNITLNYGKYIASIKEPYVSNIPSTDKVNKALVQLARRMIVCYDTKVVETGATLKALQDLRHPTPGIAAIVDLNR